MIDSIALFGDKEAGGIVLLKSYNEYYHGYKDGGKDERSKKRESVPAKLTRFFERFFDISSGELKSSEETRL